MAPDNRETGMAATVGGMKLTLIMTMLCLVSFLTGLDQTILATAAPIISDEFDALDDIAWWTNMYLLMLSSFQLFYGKMYTLFPTKVIYIGAIALFEVGSLICTTAPNSTALIIGRAIAGLGAAGIYSGGVLITTKVIPLSRRPTYLGINSAIFGVGAISGPFIGGALTDQSTWRWCFGINLPIGVCAIVLCVFLVKTPAEPATTSLTLKAKLKQFDIPGTVLLVSGLICLLLGLQWGGSIYPWRSGRVIGLLVLSGVLLLLFTTLQASHGFGKTGTIPSTITKSRDIWLAATYTMGMTGGIYVMMVYLPFWFQIVRGKSALSSGVLLTPTIGTYAVGSAIAGRFTSFTGYYNPGMILGTVLVVSGAAVLTTLHPDISTQKVIGYEILYGFGAGFGFGQPTFVVQTLLPECDVPIGVTFISLIQNLGASIFVAAAQSLFQNDLVQKVALGSSSSASLQTGASSLISSIPPGERVAAVNAFNDALVDTFYISLAVSCTTVFGALGIRWTSMKGSEKPNQASEDLAEDPPHVEERNEQEKRLEERSAL